MASNTEMDLDTDLNLNPDMGKAMYFLFGVVLTTSAILGAIVVAA